MYQQQTEFTREDKLETIKQAKHIIKLAKEFQEFQKTECYQEFIGKHLDAELIVRNLPLAKSNQDRENIAVVLNNIGFTINLMKQAELAEAQCNLTIARLEEEIQAEDEEAILAKEVETNE